MRGLAGGCRDDRDTRPGGVDREPYLQEKWTDDGDRCRATGIGDGVAFATKPELASTMIGRARKAGVPFAWVAGDEGCGGNPRLRGRLEAAGIPCVMATAYCDIIPLAADGMRACEILALIPRESWQRLSCADGSKGPQLYDWALIATAKGPAITCSSAAPCSRAIRASSSWRSSRAGRPPRHPARARRRGRRPLGNRGLLRRGEADLDHHQVHRYRAWYRHATLAMVGCAFLARASRPGMSPAAGGNPRPGR